MGPQAMDLNRGPHKARIWRTRDGEGCQAFPWLAGAGRTKSMTCDGVWKKERKFRPPLSFPRKREGGFTLEVQQFEEDLGARLVAEAFSWGVIIEAEEGEEALICEDGEVCFAGDEAAGAADGVFDSALLPRGIGVAEVGLDGELVERLVASELGSVVEGDGLTQRLGEGGEQGEEAASDAVGGFARQSCGEEDARLAFMKDEHGLAVFGEQHEVGFPMAGGVAIGGDLGPFGHGNAAFDEVCGAAAAPAAKAALAFGAREIMAPAIVLGAGDLGVDETIDAFMADHRPSGFAGEAAGDLFGRPALGEAVEHGAAQLGLALEARARPAPRRALLVSVGRFVAGFGPIALQFARDGRWRAIQSCRDLPERGAIGLKSGNLASLLQ